MISVKAILKWSALFIFDEQYKRILGNDQLDALFLNVFILRLYMFRAANAHHQEGQILLIHHLV
jgi:hypothetical protein